MYLSYLVHTMIMLENAEIFEIMRNWWRVELCYVTDMEVIAAIILSQMGQGKFSQDTNQYGNEGTYEHYTGGDTTHSFYLLL